MKWRNTNSFQLSIDSSIGEVFCQIFNISNEVKKNSRRKLPAKCQSLKKRSSNILFVPTLIFEMSNPFYTSDEIDDDEFLKHPKAGSSGYILPNHPVSNLVKVRSFLGHLNEKSLILMKYEIWNQGC